MNLIFYDLLKFKRASKFKKYFDQHYCYLFSLFWNAFLRLVISPPFINPPKTPYKVIKPTAYKQKFMVCSLYSGLIFWDVHAPPSDLLTWKWIHVHTMGADFHWGLIFKTKILHWPVLYYGWDIYTALILGWNSSQPFCSYKEWC